MLEFIEVPQAPFAPYGCVACRSNTGPLLDTHVENAAFGRVYLCQSCIARGARLFGFAEGERMDELVDAAKLAASAERENVRLTEERDMVLDQLAEELKRNEALSERLAGNEQRIEQMKATAREGAQHLLDVAGISIDSVVGKVGASR